MKSTSKQVLNLIIILCVFNFYFSTATIFQRITYKNYIPKEVAVPAKTDYHEIEIEWADAANKLPDLVKEDPTGSKTWLYSMKRSDESSFISDQVNEYDFHFTNRRFKPYLFNFDGLFTVTSNISDSMAYVAWEIEPSCVAEKHMKVNLRVKYFSSEERANAFYQYFLPETTDKVLVIKSGVATGFENKVNNEFDPSDYIGFDSTHSFVNSCASD